MTIYILNTIIFSIFSILSVLKGSKIKDKYFLECIFLVSLFYLIIIAGTRVGVGADYFSYLENYRIIQIGFRTKMELLSYYIFKLSPKYWISLMVFSIFSIFLKIFTIKKMIKYNYISLFLYVSFVYYSDMTRIREGLVSSIFIYSYYRLIKDGKKMKYFMLIFIATLVQASSIMYIIVPFIMKRKLKKNNIISIISMSFLLGQLNIANFLKSGLKKIPYISSRYSIYFNDGSRFSKQIGFTPGIVLVLFIVIFFAFNLKKLRNKKNFQEIFKVYFFGANIYLLFNSFAISATRGSDLFTFTSYLLIPYSVECFKKEEKIYAVFFIIILGVYLNYRSLNLIHFVPYKSLIL